MKNDNTNTGWKIYSGLGMLQQAAAKFLAITTAIFIFSIAMGFVPDSVGHWKWWIAALMIVLTYFIIDHGITKGLEYIFDDYRQVNNDELPEERRTALKMGLKFFVAILIVRLVLTATSSIWAAPDVAELVTDQESTEKYNDNITENNLSYQATLKMLEKEVQDARKSENQRVKAATDKGKKAVLKAIHNHPDPDVGKAYLRGPKKQPWIYKTPKLKKYRSGIAEARKDSSDWVNTEYQVLIDWEQKLKNHVSGFNGVVAANTTLAGTGAGIQEKNNQKLENHENWLIFIDIACMLFLVGISYVRSQFRIAYNITPPSGFKPLSESITKARLKWWNSFIEWLEKLLKVDIDGNGTIGTVGKPHPAAAPSPSPIRGGGNEDFRQLYEEVQRLKEATLKDGLNEGFKGPGSRKTNGLKSILKDLDFNTLKAGFKEGFKVIKDDKIDDLKEEIIIRFQNRDFTKVIGDTRNYWRGANKELKNSPKASSHQKIQSRKAKEENFVKYQLAKMFLQSSGYKVEEVSPTSLKIEKS
jgi:hypothetical protein